MVYLFKRWTSAVKTWFQAGKVNIDPVSEMGQMEILPQTVESNLSLSTFTREGHQTPWPS